MVEKRVRFCVCDLNPPIMIENVPAYVCDTCGDEIFSESAIEVFERTRDGEIPHSRTQVVKVFDFECAIREHEPIQQFGIPLG